MIIKQLIEKLSLSLYCGADNLEQEISGGYVSDLLSDVMGSAQAGTVWITLQNHINVVAVASLKELACIVLVKGIEPDPEMLHIAEQKDVTVLGTKEETFEIAGKIYEILQK